MDLLKQSQAYVKRLALTVWSTFVWFPYCSMLSQQGQALDAVCGLLLNQDVLEELLVRHLRFGGFGQFD